MTNEDLKKHGWIIGIVILLVVGWYFSTPKFGAGVPGQVRRNVSDLIGTNAVPLALTSAYTGGGSASSSALNVEGLVNFAFSGKYTPSSHGSVMQLLVERSLDGGTTYRPYNILEVQSGQILVHTSSTQGVPFVVPGSGVSTSGTAISFDFDLTMVADYVKVSAREVTTSTAGTVYVRSNIQSN